MKPSSTERAAAVTTDADLSARQATLAATSASEHPGCLICSAANAYGLKLRFRVQGPGSILAMLPCREVLQGYPKMLHGGVISAVLDAAMTNALFSMGVVAVTAEMTVRFLAPVSLGRGAVVRATVERASNHLLYQVRSELEQDREIMARASAKFLHKDHL